MYIDLYIDIKWLTLLSISPHFYLNCLLHDLNFFRAYVNSGREIENKENVRKMQKMSVRHKINSVRRF